MKKFLLSVGVLVIFLAYSMVLRNQHSGAVIAPAALSQGKSTIPTTGGTAAYKDGTYTGSVQNAFYGDVQVSATILDGKITTVDFLEYPNDNPNSQYVNQQAIPYLKQEAIKAQSANVNTVTGATLTSQAFVQSLSTALNAAKQHA
jgi:uncharacterized protein with FMN-binding domain